MTTIDDDLVSFIDVQLEHPTRISEQIEENIRSEKFLVMWDIFEIIQRFLTKNNAVMYGGLAINLLLPKKLQFYNKDELPDFDGFVNNADNKSIELADLLVKNGFTYTEVKHAMHEGTYKVFSNFEPVADLTSLNTQEHQLMLKHSQEMMYDDRPIKVASTEYLKAMAYQELALPMTAHFRWTKVLNRLLLLEYSYRVHRSDSIKDSDIYLSKILPKEYSRVYTHIKRYISKNELVLVGSQSVVKYLQIDVLNRKTNSLTVMSNDPVAHVDEMRSLIESYDYEVNIQTMDSIDKFIPTKHVLNIRSNKSNGRFVKLISVYDATTKCFSYYKHGNYRYGSMYFEMYLLNIKLFMQIGNIKENETILHLLRNVVFDDTDDSKIAKRFQSDCYGHADTILNIKRCIWDTNKRLLFYRPKLK